jgi:hypothetical protein
VDADPAPDVVRRTEGIARDLRAAARPDADDPLLAELGQALDQLAADRANGEPLGAAFGRLCEAIAAARSTR